MTILIILNIVFAIMFMLAAVCTVIDKYNRVGIKTILFIFISAGTFVADAYMLWR